MRLVFLHGPPAAGKYTIAEALHASVGWRNLHNHLTIDVAKAVLDFGTPAFWELVQDLRKRTLTAAAKTDRTVVMTCCYDHPVDLPMVEDLQAIVAAHEGTFHPVFLRCDPEELLRRVGNDDRVAKGKVSTLEGLRDAITEWNCIALPHGNTLVLDTDGKSAEACAEAIVEALGAD